MKAISIRQPFASAILLGWKTVEIRSWRTNYRGELLICATQKNFSSQDGKFFPGGLALGVVEILDVHPMTPEDLKHAFEPDATFTEHAKDYAWIVKHLYDIIPFPVKGKQGFYTVEHELIPLPKSYTDHLAYLAAQKPTQSSLT